MVDGVDETSRSTADAYHPRHVDYFENNNQTKEKKSHVDTDAW